MEAVEIVWAARPAVPEDVEVQPAAGGDGAARPAVPRVEMGEPAAGDMPTGSGDGRRRLAVEPSQDWLMELERELEQPLVEQSLELELPLVETVEDVRAARPAVPVFQEVEKELEAEEEELEAEEEDVRAARPAVPVFQEVEIELEDERAARPAVPTVPEAVEDVLVGEVPPEDVPPGDRGRPGDEGRPGNGGRPERGDPLGPKKSERGEDGRRPTSLLSNRGRGRCLSHPCFPLLRTEAVTV